MPSTFTTNTGIEKPDDGEQAGLWGNTVNLNSDILDRALNGVGFISLTTSTYTLTTSSGTLSDGQYDTVFFTGTPGVTVTVTVAPTTAQKTYAILNGTNQSIVITQGSGSNVTLQAGAGGIVACSGGGATASVYEITALMNTATSANTANAVVRRDGSGNFVAGTVTAALTGNVTGNASTATTWQTARNLTINGVSKSVNGSADVAFTGPEVGSIPSGGIIMWSGSIASIPAGWILCDGNNGTPDLRDRFVVSVGSTYAVGDIGGAAVVSLTEADLPSHTHSFSATTGAAGAHSHTGTANYVSLAGTLVSGGRGQFSATQYGIVGNPQGLSNHGSGTGIGGVYSNVDIDASHSHTLSVSIAADHTHTVSGTTGATGSGSAHENRPPYYALAYIMKA